MKFVGPLRAKKTGESRQPLMPLPNLRLLKTLCCPEMMMTFGFVLSGRD